MNYYYLVASLPLLQFDAPAPMTVQAFRDLCAENLSPRDLRTLDEVLAPRNHPTGSAFARQWGRIETALRNALVRVRASRLKVDADAHLRDGTLETAAEQAAADAYSRPNPKERELALDRFRWAQLEALAGFDPFTARAVFVYALKLKLAERWTTINPETGTERADAIINKDPEDNTDAPESRAGDAA